MAKKKVSLENANLKKRNKRLQKKCYTLKQTIIELKKKLVLPEDQYREVLLKAEAADMLTRMARQNRSMTNIRMKFTPSLRKFALTLNFYSPVGYKYVRKIFNNVLPHPRTLGKWYQNTDAAPGFTTEAFDVLKRKHVATGKRLLCTLVVDEMAVRQQTSWSGKKSLGLVNCGAGPVDRVASQAFVMMLVCSNENWKLPIGYFFVDGLTAECRANLIKIALSNSWQVGVDVVALTFDGCPSNISAANLLGCHLDDINTLKTTFQHPSCDKKVAVFLDPCHMLKLVRNTFESKRVLFDSEGKEIQWKLLENLLSLQTNETLNFANKLSARHINFRNQIMKVKLATQLLSKSVATAIKLCEEILVSSRFVNTDPTVKFIENFNNIFDIMNSRKRERFGFKKPICRENKDDIFTFMDYMKDYIISLQMFVKTRRVRRGRVTMTISKKKVIQSRRKTGFLGFIVCIESLKHLYSTLVESDMMEYISVYRLSQDHLELLFGIIRRQGGYNNNPNFRQFRGIYRKLLGHLELRSSFSGNCIPLDNFPILNCSSAINNINMIFDRYDDSEEEDKENSSSNLFGTDKLPKHKTMTRALARKKVQITKKK